MNRKFVPIFVVLILALATLACGGGEEAASPTPAATDQPAAPPPTSPPAGGEEEVEEEPHDYDTVFPLPDDVQEFRGEGGEEQISFQTGLSIDEAIEFYRQAMADQGLTEYPVLTGIEDDGFSMVFTGWPSGEEVVIQGVDFDDSVNVSIRLEEVLDEAEVAPSDTTLGEELRSDVGGFACQTIPGYTVEEAFGFASMEAPDADPDLGPAVMLIGSAEEVGDAGPQDLYDGFMSELEAGIDVSEPRETTVGGVPALIADISGTSDGEEMAGQVVFVAVSPTQQFIMFGAAPQARWDDEFAPQFEAVLASVTFFEPGLSLEAEEEEFIAGDEIRQWASYAEASSEYGNPDWAAVQATGAPDTPECGDYVTAWASDSSDTVEWIELSYDVAVYPTEVNIVQSYSPNQVLYVDLLDTDGEYHEIYLGEPVDRSDSCPYTLSIPVEDADYLAVAVKITIDQSVLANWNEIDAVELVGIFE